MNIYDPYPDRVEADGKEYKLNLAYDRVLMVIDAQDDPTLTDEDRIELQARLLLADARQCPKTTAAQAQLVAAVFALFPRSEKTTERYIDFHQDAAMIRSAFFRIGVDLTREHPHFLQFLELLADLPSDTALMRTVEIRQRPIPKPTKHNGEQIAALQEAKARVALKVSDEERRARFAASLKQSSILRG